MPDTQSAILFTAFEPSGDDLAAAVIRIVRERHPDAPIFAWGGVKMQAAGATLVKRTGADAVVGIPGPGKILEHLRLNKRIGRWMDTHAVALHVPVDSPAANFPICKLAKARGIRVAHLAAPQLWAWAPWRIHKLRRLTDLVMCLLPFEEQWFRDRGVASTFIGHPLFDQGAEVVQNPERKEGVDPAELRPAEETSSLRLGVMPGSRPRELDRHVPLICRTLDALLRGRPDLAIRLAAPDEPAASRVRELADRRGGLPEDAKIVAGPHAVARVAAWADVCLTKSGTVTLHIVKERCPMVVIYRTTTLGYLLVGRWLITTPYNAMPNLIAGRKIVEEFVPHLGGPRPIVAAVQALLDDASMREQVRRDLDDVAKQFEGRSAADAAADEIERLAISSR